MVVLIYFTIELEEAKSLEIIRKIKDQNDLTIVFRVKFFSYLYKSTKSPNLKKWLIKACVELIENEPKTSYFSSFVENFDRLMDDFEAKDLSGT